MPFAASVPKQPAFDLNKETVLYIFGYIESLKAESVKTVVTAYQQKNQHNILVLDWEKIVARNYVFQTFPDTVQVCQKKYVYLL